ncbi:MAG: bile acid:sodium symporter family protein [Planctomycetota bacterium]|jgi:BASS family bile acid:Na+ symporter
MQRLSLIIQRFLLIWLLLFSAVAYFWPELFGTGAVDPFVASKPHIGLMISVTMFCIGCLLTTNEIDDVIRRWPTVLGGTAVQYTTMPLLAYACGHLFGLDDAYLIGVIVVGCVPGAMASNVLTLAARGNVSYSVSLTTSATILSPLIVPLALKLTLGATKEIDPVAEAIKLLMQIVGPVIIGHVLCRFSDDIASMFRPIAPIVANCTIVWLIAVVVGLNRDRLGAAFSGEETGSAVMLAALLIINVLGYLAGNSGARAMRLQPDMQRAMTLEVGMQNAGVGTWLVLGLFPEQPEAAIPTAVYTFGCMMTGTVLAQWWGRNTPDGTEAGSASDNGGKDVEAGSDGGHRTE